MKIRKAALLALIGIILNILSVVLNFFIQYNKAFLISNSMRIAGSILLVMFFYVFIVRQQETSSLRIAGILGLIGYLIIIILNISGTVFNSVFIIAVKDPLKYKSLMSMASLLSRVNFLIGLIPIVLLIASFMIFHSILNKNGPLKKAALFALIGQLISLIEWIIGCILNIFLFKMLYQIIDIRGLIIISTVESVIEIIPLVLLAIFFISLYRLLNNNEDMQQLKVFPSILSE